MGDPELARQRIDEIVTNYHKPRYYSQRARRDIEFLLYSEDFGALMEEYYCRKLLDEHRKLSLGMMLSGAIELYAMCMVNR